MSSFCFFNNCSCILASSDKIGLGTRGLAGSEIDVATGVIAAGGVDVVCLAAASFNFYKQLMNFNTL